MPLSSNSLAKAVGSGVQNVAFRASASVLPRKILIIGTYDPAKTAIVAETPLLITSPEDAGSKFGFGFMVHRLALKAALGSQGIETWIMPQSEAGGAAAAAGEIDFTGSTGVLAGTLAVYIAGDRIPVTITAGMTVENIADAVVAAINAVAETPVIAAKTAVTFEVTFTAKSKGPEGNNIDISLSIEPGDETPTGIASAITPMAAGSGIPTMGDALDALGTGDNANEAGFTELIHGYGQDSTTLDAISTYVGEGNDFTGLYSKTVARPFRSLTGDTVAGSSGLTAQIVISDGRLDDRSQGVVSVPDSQSHPAEIAAQTLGHMARINNVRAEEACTEITLIGVQPGAKANRWTSSYSSRDTAVKAGISPTLVDGGVVKLQNVVSFYRPASVPVTSNGYREMVNISKLQNILASQKTNFSRTKWQNVSIVSDVAKVTNPTSRQKARDVDSVLDDLIQLVNEWAGNAWIASADFTIGRLKADSSLVTIRSSGDGFNVTIPVVLSGIGNIYDVVTQFDISFAVLING
jgi:phage tail sheath gpL-like